MSFDSLVISDTSSIILLDKIDEFDILKLSFDKVYTTPIVAKEFGVQLPDWITIQNVTNVAVENMLNELMDPGEASVLALATEIKDCYVLIDDHKARNYAEKTGQKFLGTLGLILRAKRLGVIPSVRPYLDKIRKTDFWVSEALYDLVLKEAGEE